MTDRFTSTRARRTGEAPVLVAIRLHDDIRASMVSQWISMLGDEGCLTELTLEIERAEVIFFEGELKAIGNVNPRAIKVQILSRRLAGSSTFATHNERTGGISGEVFDDLVSPQTLLPWCLLALASRNSDKPASSATQFLARGAHELRTPLTAILAHVESLKDPSLDYVAQMQVLSEIRGNGRFLLELIDDVLLYSRMEVGEVDVKREPVDIERLCGELQPLLQRRAEERGDQFLLEFSYPLPRRISMDPLRLRQIILNLVGNAIKFTENGSVALVVSFRESDGSLTLDVIDTGVGIAIEYIESIFQPFKQAGRFVEQRFGGSGLGLAVTKGLVDALGGAISVKSALGEGSIFSVSFPAEVVNGELVTGKDFARHGARNDFDRVGGSIKLTGRVLIADDTAATRELLEGLFRFAGAEVTTVADGAKALERGEKEDFDLIIMDAEMPVMSGYTAMEHLRAGGVQAPIVAVTAHLHREELQKCIAAGANQFVSKASSMDEILLIAEQYIGALPNREADSETLLKDSATARIVMAKAKLKYLNRFERSLAPLRETVERRQWARVSKILHPLSSAKMFGFTHVTEELRIISMQLHRLFSSEREVSAQIANLALLEKPLAEARLAIERELRELEGAEPSIQTDGV